MIAMHKSTCKRLTFTVCVDCLITRVQELSGL